MIDETQLRNIGKSANIQKYEYPDKLDLRPGSDLSKKLVDEIKARVLYGTQAVHLAKDNWEAIDWTLSAFVPPEALDEDKRLKHYDPGRPIATVVPVSLASMDTFLTYFDSVFNKDPMYQFRGVGGTESIVRTAMMEKIIHKQSRWFKHSEATETAWRDSLAYGVGYTALDWSKRKAYRAYDPEVLDQAVNIFREMGMKVNKDGYRRMMEEVVVAEGTRLIPIDPYRSIVDPSVTPETIQDSEYFGWQERHNVMNLLLREADPEENLFNIKYVRLLSEDGEAHSSRWIERAAPRDDRFYFSHEMPFKRFQNIVDLSRMYIKLIPKEWKLGKEEYPCLYGITLAGEDIIVQCKRLDFAHGMIPVAACAPASNGHSIIPVSHIASTYGIQRAVDFFVNSHNFNCSKAINDMFIVNQRYVNMEDVLQGGPGKMIRLTDQAFGIDDIRKVMMQFPVNDVTGNHMRDAQSLTEMLRQVNGTVDIAMGDLSGMPERPTATGVNAAQTGALSRLQHLAKRIAVQYMYDLAWQQAYNNMQFLDIEIQINAMGRYEQELMKAFGHSEDILVSPLDLSANFEIDIESYAIPGNNNVEAVTQIMQMLLSMETIGSEFAQSIQFIPLFMHWAKITGADDVSQFINTGGQMEQMPDQQVQQQVEQGNLVPMGN